MAACIRDRLAAAEAFVPILAAEVRALVAEGATSIQIDEPSPAIHPEASADFAALFNTVVAGVPAGVRLATHLCFGNFMGRPLAERTTGRCSTRCAGSRVDELVLELANREMAELEICADVTDRFDMAAGVIDVKNSYVESATRSPRGSTGPRRTFRRSACRWCRTVASARPPAGHAAKLHALVEGRDLVRGRR